MRIRIQGRNRRVARDELRYAVQWMCQQLMPPEVVEDLRITLVSCRLPDDNAWMTPTEYTPSLRSFKVVLDSSNARHRQLRYLAHELCHVKQYAMREMRDRWVPVRSPKGVRYKIKEIRFKKWIFNPVLVEYNRQPWEVEARRTQEVLYRAYRDHIDTLDESFRRP